jgi:hypothetical protein
LLEKYEEVRLIHSKIEVKDDGPSFEGEVQPTALSDPEGYG